jgi:ankyrin repeat protein
MPPSARLTVLLGGLVLFLALVYIAADPLYILLTLDGKLFRAVTNGRLEEASRLISMGADVNATRFFDSSGTNVLMVASERGDAPLVKLLLEKGANVNAKTKFNATPLSLAIPRGHGAIVETLIAHGANVNESIDIWDFPLKEATVFGHTEIVKALLAHGADVNRKDYMGRTALMVAQERNYGEIKKLLVQYGAGREQSPVQRCDYKKAEEQIDGYQSVGLIQYIKGTDVYVAEKWLVSTIEHKKLINQYVMCFLTKGAMDSLTVYYLNNYTGHVMAIGTPSGFEM